MSLSNQLIVDPIDIMSAVALTVSGGATPLVTGDAIHIGFLSKIHVFCLNAGASTNVTVTIKGKPSAASTLESTLAVFNLGATGTSLAKAGRYIEQFPKYIWAVASNADVANGATVSVVVDRFR